MPKEIIAGISVEGNAASLAVVEHRDGERALLFLDERERHEENEFWYCSLLDRFQRQSRLKIQQVGIALDASSVTIIQCPIDISLNQSDRNQHINWELSQYVEHYNPREYINDVHVLETRAQERIQNILVVSVKRNTIFGLQETLTKRQLLLGIVDINHFATDAAILWSHPEHEKALCCSVGIHAHRIDASILRNGRTTAYRYVLNGSDGETETFLSALVETQPVVSVYVHGSDLSVEMEKKIQSISHAPVAVLNPFRRMVVSRDFPAFTRFAPFVHRFAAAVGIALRKS